MMNVFKIRYKTPLFVVVLLFSCTNQAFAQFHFQDEPALQVIRDIHKATSFRFLYRDALVANINFSFNSSPSDIWKNFSAALETHHLDLKIDSSRHQAIIFQRQNRKNRSKKITIQGEVVDGTTGERLPFANIYWISNGHTFGLNSNGSGAFVINRFFRQPSINIRCSYVGYETKTITLDLQKGSDISDLTFRLQPKQLDAHELVVLGKGTNGNLNKHASDLININTFSPMGESNTMRALKALPSVSLSPALSGGLNVRGSPDDGFRVLLNGITIFNQSHLFGLVDSFNADALQRVGFYYDIIPASYQAPSGGTLLLQTKTGSLQKLSGSGGISNTAVRFMLGGPIEKGRSSWVIAGRKSYMNAVNWFHNAKLIRWGLGVNRGQSKLNSNLLNFQSYLVHPNQSDASFFDVDGKLYFEQKNGDRFIVSGYFGGDHTRQLSKRLYRSSSSGNNGFTFRPVQAKNNWLNGAASVQYQHWLGSEVYANTTAGFSIYQTNFSKDDFSYLDINPLDQSLEAFIYPFQNKSVMNEFKAEQKFEIYPGFGKWATGITYKYYLGEYLEHSFNRPGYFSEKSTNKLSAFGQFNYTDSKLLHFFAGGRVFYYSNGSYLRVSPRAKFTLFPGSSISLSGGFSRDYQFLNQVNLENAVTANVWILAGEDQPPASVNYYSAGAHFDITDFLYLQAEAYLKKFDHLRLDELDTFSLSSTFNSNPWFNDNSGTGKGLEFLVHADIKNPVSLTQTFTFSNILLSNPKINSGNPFHPDWARRYQYTAKLAARPAKKFSVYLSWQFATGAPNRLAVFGPLHRKRLGDYRRMDLSAAYKPTLHSVHLKVEASLFNVLNHANPWYRDQVIAVDKTPPPGAFRDAPVTVYDIGFQPSFNVNVNF